MQAVRRFANIRPIVNINLLSQLVLNGNSDNLFARKAREKSNKVKRCNAELNGPERWKKELRSRLRQNFLKNLSLP